MKKILLLIFLPIIAFANDSINVELGIPINLDSSTLNVLEKNEYWSGFRCDYGVPLWVSYNLNADWYGTVERWSGNFIVDSTLPKTCWIKHSDYTNSGYDRGHMVRSEERTRTVDENKATFKTSNIIPQLPELNQQTWLKLEYYCEKLAKDSLKEMYIIDGPIFSKQPVQFYNNKIAIPDSCYKIIIVINKGQTLKDVNENTEVIAVNMPNNDSDVKNHDWKEYLTTIRRIEISTKLDFLSNLSISLQDKLENKLMTSIKENLEDKIIIYPNPASEFIEIKSKEYNNIEIYNTFGELILNSIQNENDNHIIDISKLVNGMYFIKVGTKVDKFIKF